MLLLIRRRTITLLAVVSITISLGMGAVGYLAILHATDLDAGGFKLLAERLLFGGILATVLMLGTALYVAVETINLNAVFRRMAEMHRMGAAQMTASLRRLGEVGTHIRTLYDNINFLSARKSTRIVAMNGLVTTILSRSPRRILVVNAAGAVYRSSPAALKHLDRPAAEVAGKHIDTLVDAEVFSVMSARVAGTVGLHVAAEGEDPVVVLPVTNDRGQVAYYVYLLGDDAREELEQRRAAMVAPGGEETGADGGEPSAGAPSGGDHEAGKARGPNLLLTRIGRAFTSRFGGPGSSK